MTSLFALFNLGPPEIIIILVVGILLFGRRLPEVGRYLGKGIVEFKKGIRGVEDDIDVQAGGSHGGPSYQPPEPPRPPQRVGATGPKFEEQPVDSEGKARY
ncbi:MAG: twin-arginine translocase TatA/TatE family subunit [Gemmatales bacterium]|nr:twin-arginine translocase TatA/TatE family subunit [Gemmatales bacterium]MDW8386129.1 twin-arginine translocase TatA/TatE family subunit [Gemmatales bacterium]